MALARQMIVICALLALGATTYCQGLDAAGQKELAEWTVAEIKSRVESSISLSELYYGVEALAEQSAASLKQLPTAEACNIALAPAPDSLADNFYAVSVMHRLGCKGSDKVAAAADAAATAALSSPLATVADGYHAVATLAALKALGKKVKAPALDKLSSLLTDLVHSSGAVKSDASAKLPSFEATGMAYGAIVAAKAFKSGFSVAAVEKGAPKVLELAKPDGGLWGKLDTDHIETTARVLQGALALGAKAADPTKLAKTAGFLSSALPAGSLSDAYFAPMGLKALAGGPKALTRGVVIAPGDTAGTGGKGKVSIKLSAAYDGSAPSCTVTGNALSKMAKKGDKGISLKFSAGSGGAYTATFAAPELGAYTVTVEASDCDDAAPGLAASTSFDATVSDKADISDVAVSTGGSSGDSTTKASYPQPLGKKLKLAPESQIKVSFKVTAGGKAFTPQQAIAVLSSKKRPGAMAYFTAKAKGDSLAVVITSAGLEKRLGTLGGEYSLRLLVGDAGMDSAIDWALSDSVSVLFKPLEDGSQPPDPAPQSAVFDPLPRILHMHRAPEKQPPLVVSLAFAGATLAPLAGVVVALGMLGANLKGLPSGIAPLLFHGGILAILVLYYMFWTKLDLLQTLPLLGLLGLATGVSGYYALSARADARLKSE